MQKASPTGVRQPQGCLKEQAAVGLPWRGKGLGPCGDVSTWTRFGSMVQTKSENGQQPLCLPAPSECGMAAKAEQAGPSLSAPRQPYQGLMSSLLCQVVKGSGCRLSLGQGLGLPSGSGSEWFSDPGSFTYFSKLHCLICKMSGWFPGRIHSISGSELGRFCPPGTLGEGVTGYSPVGRGQEAAKHSTMHSTAPPPT